MLGIAYAASIGGMATLVGTPPNLLFAGQAPTLAPGTGEVSFARWMLLGLPLSVAYLSLAWAYLAFLVLRPSPTPSDPPAPSRPAPQAPMTWPQRAVTFVFLATVFAWVFKTDLDLGAFTLPGWATWLGLEVHDATIALTAALILFVLPSGRGRRDFVLDWRTAASIPWEVLILFGGGFALAQGFVASGLAERLGALLSALDVLPLPLVILALCVVVVVGSEIASNTALTAIILPVAAATAQGMGLHPYWLMVPATLAASTGFMLPVATPPNAVAFASGYVTAPQMAKAGVVLDLLGILLVTAASLTLLPWAFSLT
ncbi:MAG: SLC13 family permease, partial [Candidatus Thermoplasmatota archaeon]|nr:SLC13 family permease [Candidatus Thermoplasmatota archaeon]